MKSIGEYLTHLGGAVVIFYGCFVVPVFALALAWHKSQKDVKTCPKCGEELVKRPRYNYWYCPCCNKTTIHGKELSSGCEALKKARQND